MIKAQCGRHKGILTFHNLDNFSRFFLIDSYLFHFVLHSNDIKGSKKYFYHYNISILSIQLKENAKILGDCWTAVAVGVWR